ncbi:hypothetical protein BMD22_05635 [Burkholderia multivorans]|nr:hypothetical protein BMD22_05635 [Burkholderia multivorans]
MSVRRARRATRLLPAHARPRTAIAQMRPHTACGMRRGNAAPRPPQARGDQVARTATPATPPLFSIARADTIDSSAESIT